LGIGSSTDTAPNGGDGEWDFSAERMKNLWRDEVCKRRLKAGACADDCFSACLNWENPRLPR
jgi:hypothetical protein